MIIYTFILFPCPILFSTLGNSLATLFQLFTLDHWFDVLNDLSIVSNELVSKFYVILWICIGAFIFRNIFAGIMGKFCLIFFYETCFVFHYGSTMVPLKYILRCFSLNGCNFHSFLD